MLKKTLALVGLLLSLSANAGIVSLGSSFGADTVTRDTDTGLDWLDVTVTRGLSYDEVTAQLGQGGAYEGFRYATTIELDALIANFGYTPLNSTCRYGLLYCDHGFGGDNEIVETMILTLGDTKDAYLVEQGSLYRASPSGAGYTYGLIDDMGVFDGTTRVASIFDNELYWNGQPQFDNADTVQSLAWAYNGLEAAGAAGSFLVQASLVPVPATVWLFGSALIGLVGIKRKK